MRAILIDPQVQMISEFDIDGSHDAMRKAIGGFPERAGVLSSGDNLYVDANGFVTSGNKLFDIGAHQNFAGRGLIVGAKPLSNARISIPELEKSVTYPVKARLSPPRVTSFDNMGEALDYLSAAKRASNAVPLDRELEAEISLLPSLEEVDDGIFGLGCLDDDEDDLSPHIEMFPKSGNTELIHIPARFSYNVNSEGVCWLVPRGVKAERLKAALKSGEPLRGALSRARLAALTDAGIHAACTAVTEELDRLARP